MKDEIEIFELNEDGKPYKIVIDVFTSQKK